MTTIRMVMLPDCHTDPEAEVKPEPVIKSEADSFNKMMESLEQNYTPLHEGDIVIKTPLRIRDGFKPTTQNRYKLRRDIEGP